MGKHSDGCPDSGHTGQSGCDNSMHGHGFNPDRERNPDNYNKCFPYSALIATPQGKIKIGDLSVGQLVWSFQNSGLVKRAITRKLIFSPSKIMQIDFEEGEASIRCAPVHSFLTSKGYLALPKIVVGDSIVHMDSHGAQSLRRVTSITDTKTVEPVFNLYTQGEHNFIVDGYVAHNFTSFRALRTMFHRLFLDGQIEANGQVGLGR